MAANPNKQGQPRKTQSKEKHAINKKEQPTSIVASPGKSQANQNIEDAPIEKMLRAKDLAPKLGISEKKVRMFLRKHYPRPEKGERWEFTLDTAKQIEKDFKDSQKEKESKKQEQINKELEGKTDEAKADGG